LKMRPRIDRSRFGSITIEGITYRHDVIIRPDGQVEERKKELSKAIYGSSHTISLEEARHIHTRGGALLIIGAGKFGRVRLSQEAAAYFIQEGCEVRLFPTSQAIRIWNESEGQAIGLFHVSC
jgi:hypothetical protein